MTAARHVPVMLDRVVSLLAPALDEQGAVLVDATVGLGGHAEALLATCPRARLVGLDRDGSALELAAARLAPYAARMTLVHAVFDTLPDVLTRLGLSRANGVLFDCGVSSMQLDVRERGFAYAVDAPLDMRMDPSAELTAAEVVNTYPVADLTWIFSRYGEERFARRIAESIARERAKQPLTRTAELTAIIRSSIPAAARRTGGNPAKRTFQALRIEVNDELAALDRALPASIDALALHGRIVVLSYHSLEDSSAKRALTARSVVTAPPGMPVIPVAAQPELRLLTRGAEPASEQEKQRNPRASSVRMRAAERIREVA
jgi:16S rRNA (cytosine1402-N4)-methyltransferase